MELDDPEFVRTVEELRALAMRGEPLSQLLECVKQRVGSHCILAIAVLHRAFALRLGDAKGLAGSWTGFTAERGYPGRTAEDLEGEYGELIRAYVRGQERG